MLLKNELKELMELVGKTILDISYYSVIWVPDFEAFDIYQIVNMTFEIRSAAFNYRFEFEGGKIIIGCGLKKDINHYTDPGSGSGIIICPHCFDKNDEKSEFKHYNIIRLGDATLEKSNILKLTCSNCSQETILKPNTPLELGYGDLKVTYSIS